MIAQSSHLAEIPPDLDWEREFNHAVRKRFIRYAQRFNSRIVRPIQQFAEQEIILPTGPREGFPFDITTQPFAKLLWDEFDNQHWNEYAITGCTQTGKSLLGFAIPVVWLLCERREDVIIAAPTKEVLQDKVRRDIMPLIEKSRYAEVWPKVGGGSQGGVPDLIELANGASLKLMSFESGDKAKASFTCPNVVFTEIDGLKQALTSAEANAMAQILGRARATARDKRFILFECTVTFEEGPIWQLVQVKGSAGEIMLECPRCLGWSCPDRPDLKGWETAENIIQAEDNTAWHCPECDAAWTEEERYQINCGAKLMHKGQKIDSRGRISGKLPPTRTLGFRFGAVNSMFLPAKDIGVDCWEARENPDEIDAEKELTMFVFCNPFKPPARSEIKFNAREVEKRRFKGWTKGMVPDGTQWITVGVDPGKYRCHWVAIAWVLTKGRSCGVIIDYGTIELALEHKGHRITAEDWTYDEIFNPCFKEWKDGVDRGWHNTDGEYTTYDEMWIDARWQGEEKDDDVIYNAIGQWQDPRLYPVIGHSTTDYSTNTYRQPQQNPMTGATGSKLIREIGNDYYIEYVPAIGAGSGLDVAHVNSDTWKQIVQARATTSPDKPGALVLYDSHNKREHVTIVKHWGSQHFREDYDPVKGRIGKWILTSHADHYLDGTGYACAAGHHVGYRKAGDKQATSKQKRPILRSSLPIEDRYGRTF